MWIKYYCILGCVALSNALLYNEFSQRGKDWLQFYLEDDGEKGTLNRQQVLQMTFQTENELFESAFWKDLLVRKIPRHSGRAFINIKELNALYFFRESELEFDNIAAPLSFSRWFRPREIKLLQVSTGEAKKLDFVDVPVTPCVSSEYSSGGASYELSSEYNLMYSFIRQPKINYIVGTTGISALVEIASIDTTFGYFTAVSCSIPAGAILQIASSFLFYSFPNAYQRNIVFKNGGFHVDKSKDINVSDLYNADDNGWVRITSENPKYKQYGMVLFDNTPPSHKCVTSKETLRCGMGFFDIKNSDPEKALEWLSL